jgi:hypothetical protein
LAPAVAQLWPITPHADDYLLLQPHAVAWRCDPASKPARRRAIRIMMTPLTATLLVGSGIDSIRMIV